MAAIEDIIKASESFSDCVGILKNDPALLERIFTPVREAGFTDFEWIGSGGNAFFIAPTDNDRIVFRVSSESARRRDDIPFFLCGAYEEIFNRPSQDPVLLEILLAGQKEIPDESKEFLLHEMQSAGWRLNGIDTTSRLWKDVVMISLRDSKGRSRAIPIISDPSAWRYYLDGAEPKLLNRCGSNYIPLQDQAAAYNAIIESDPRLKKLIPKPVQFRETEVMPTKSSGLSPQ
ncbi:MAG: hypothetical protein KGJ06_02890 [Pseudomonadota bacterium]|nr:hypothetical protein [Pseudomonadota bacterium]